MSELYLNPRYVNWARANGRSPEAQHVQDRIDWPGGAMTGFVLWNQDRLREARAEIPHAFFLKSLVDHDAYDVWLTNWVDRHLKEKIK